MCDSQVSIGGPKMRERNPASPKVSGYRKSVRTCTNNRNLRHYEKLLCLRAKKRQSAGTRHGGNASLATDTVSLTDNNRFPFTIPASLFPATADTRFNQTGLLPRNIVIRRTQKRALRIPDPLMREQCDGVMFCQLRRKRGGLPGHGAQQRCWEYHVLGQE